MRGKKARKRNRSQREKREEKVDKTALTYVCCKCFNSNRSYLFNHYRGACKEGKGGKKMRK
jgi:hypothetical protein